MVRAFELVGVLTSALLGGLIARHERLDPVGFATLAVLSALGGGIVRDVLLQQGPPVALTDQAYLLTAVIGAAISFLVSVEGPVWQRMWPLVEALGLGAWAAVGAHKALAAGLDWLPAVLLGTITAVGGGAIRDIVMRRVPEVLGGNTLYATCAIASSALVVALSNHTSPATTMGAATVLGGGLRLMARWRGWTLPDGVVWSRSLWSRARMRRQSGQGATVVVPRNRPTDSSHAKPTSASANWALRPLRRSHRGGRGNRAGSHSRPRCHCRHLHSDGPGVTGVVGR